MTLMPKTIHVEYRVTNQEGEEIDSNIGGDPLIFTIGKGEVLPALEFELDTMSVGDQKVITLLPDQAYGSVRDDAFKEVELSILPEDSREEGTTLVVDDEMGNTHHVVVKEVSDTTALLDFNHPLAGETLVFDVHVVDISMVTH